MTSRVGRVALKLRLPESERGRAASLRATVEQDLIQCALDELERIVHDELGPKVVLRVRTLSFRWQLDVGALDDMRSALEIGRDLAASVLAAVEDLPRPERLRPEPQRDVVVFADDDHAIAAYLADAAEGRHAWFHAPYTNAAQVWAVIATDTTRTRAVTRWLERMELHQRVLRWLAETVAVPPRNVDQEPHADLEVAPVVEQAARTPTDEARTADGVLVARTAAASEPGAIELDAPDVASPMFANTQVGGIWYFARLVMDLELAEALWQIGVHEGDFLARVIGTIVGPDLAQDPACRWFGGAFEHAPVLEPIAPWANDELAAKLQASLARLQVDTAPQLAPQCIGSAPDARTRATVSHCATSLVQLFCARLGIDPDVDHVRALVGIRGRLELADPLRVVLPMDAIDIDVRRAGLDVDPGYLPWMQRRVAIFFE
jgi:hypothetical protein